MLRTRRLGVVLLATLMLPLSATAAAGSSVDSAGAEAPGSAAPLPNPNAVPGLAPRDTGATAVYVNQAGDIITPAQQPVPAESEAATEESSAAAFGCTPVSGHDNPHRSSTGFAVSGHGWWDKGTCSNTRADVLNCLYQYYDDGTWRQIACSSVVEFTYGGGAGNRTTARRDCASSAYTSWRNHVSVDVKGEVDTNEVPYRQADVYCRVFDEPQR